MWRTVLAGTTGVILYGSADAGAFTMEQGAPENLAKFIQGFNSVTVRIQPESERCGIRDPERYGNALREALTAAGLKEDGGAVTSAHLFIWARAFGPLSQQCAMFTSLRLGTDVSAAAVEIDAYQDGDEVLVDQVKAVQATFPAAFFITSKLGVKLEPTAASEEDKIIQDLVADFRAARGTPSGSQ